jgi:hypothetical protein
MLRNSMFVGLAAGHSGTQKKVPFESDSFTAPAFPSLLSAPARDQLPLTIRPLMLHRKVAQEPVLMFHVKHIVDLPELENKASQWR